MTRQELLDLNREAMKKFIPPGSVGIPSEWHEHADSRFEEMPDAALAVTLAYIAGGMHCRGVSSERQDWIEMSAKLMRAALDSVA